MILTDILYNAGDVSIKTENTITAAAIARGLRSARRVLYLSMPDMLFVLAVHDYIELMPMPGIGCSQPG